MSEAPAVGVPDPVGERAVDEGSPEEGEDHGGNNTTTLSNSTDRESSSDSEEHHLVERVQKSRDERRAGRGSSPDLHETEVTHITDEGVAGGGREGKRVSPEIPLEDDDGKGHHDDPEHGEGGLSAGETGVEEGDAGNHHHDQAGGEEDVGLVTGGVPLVQVCGGGVTTGYLIGGIELGRSADVCVRHDGGCVVLSRVKIGVLRVVCSMMVERVGMN